MNPDNTIATIPQTSVWVCGTGPAQAGGYPVTNTLATINGYCPPNTAYGCPPAGQHQHQQNTAATVCTQYGCPPPAAQAAGNQQAYTMHGATVCTQFGCPPAAAQATPTHFNTAFTTCTQHVVCQPQHHVSVPPHCPTVAPMCPPPAQGGGQAQAQAFTFCCLITMPQQAQAQGSYYTQQCGGQPAQLQGGTPQAAVQSTAQSTGNPVTGGILCSTQICPTTILGRCGGYTGGTPVQGPPHTSFGCVVQPHTFFGCQPTQSVASCTTIAGLTHNPPMCPPPPANAGGQAQAQFPTWPIDQCTIVPATITIATTGTAATTIALTAVAGCLPQQGQQAQAQGSYYTMTCPAPQGQGQQQVLPHTIFPPLCQPVGGNTGAYTHHLMGCTTVTSNPATPSTHFPGCTGVTATPATVGQTQLLGCTTITSTPQPQAQASDNGWTAVKACTTYAVAPAQAPNNGWTAIPACTTYAAAPAPMQGSVQIPNHGGQTGALPPTYHPAGGCGPAPQAANANGGGQAQAQLPTIPVVSCAASAIGVCTHIWPIC